MANLTISIDCGNAAFVPMVGNECARILRQLADHLDGTDVAELPLENSLFDVNGNYVGAWCLTDGKG